MPIYEYECKKCHAHHEVMQKITDKPLAKCKKCGGRLEKQWSSTSFQLKGSGWYVTDYAAKKSDSKEDKKSEAKSEAKSESKEEKPAAKDDKNASAKSATSASDKAASSTAKSKTKNTSSNTSGD